MRHDEKHNAGKTIAVYPGSFDPITNGHLDIIRRATYLFDQVHVLLAINPQKTGRDRLLPGIVAQGLVEKSLEHLEGHTSVSSMNSLELTVDFCTRLEARAMIRGLRTVSDFDAEFGLAIANMGLAKHIETVFLVPQPENHFVSSSRVREIAKIRGADAVKDLVPPPVYEYLREHRWNP